MCNCAFSDKPGTVYFNVVLFVYRREAEDFHNTSLLSVASVPSKFLCGCIASDDGSPSVASVTATMSPSLALNTYTFLSSRNA